MIAIDSPVRKMSESYHYPVMNQEVARIISPNTRGVIVDCTLGMGSHAKMLYGEMKEGGIYVGIDRDEDSVRLAAERISPAPGVRVELAKSDFTNVEAVMRGIGVDSADVFFFDLGISTYQLVNPERGFSFLREGPLDMRMDRDAFLCAYDLVNNLSVNELENIFRKFGEEHLSHKIACSIVEARRIEPVSTTTQLARIIQESVGSRYGGSRINPATRVFQSLRIAVNRELTALEEGLLTASRLLNPEGAIVVISFHSLEDRIVKNFFKKMKSQGSFDILTKKPLVPQEHEISENPASRSAKLRAAKRGSF